MHQGATTNPHGFGFAIIAGDKIISERTMSAKRSIARFLMFREQYPDSYAIWHSRIATHGVKNEQNCHPFQVGGSPITYLAHNGMLDVDQPKDDRKSDSRVFAEQVLPAMGGVCALDNPTVFEMVSRWASGSKLAILTLDPNAEHQLYIINEKSGSWDDNHVWWSNTRHRPSKVYNWDGRVIGKPSDTTGTFSVDRKPTRVRSILNPVTKEWERPKDGIIYYREWKAGDIWDYSLQGYTTPLPGTVEPDNVLYLPSHRDMVIEALNSEDEEEYEPLEAPCPHCNTMSDLNRDVDYCLNCNLCYECGQHRRDCMCYIPGGWKGHW